MKNILLATVSALAISSPALAAEDFKAGDFMVRARALGVCPVKTVSYPTAIA